MQPLGWKQYKYAWFTYLDDLLISSHPYFLTSYTLQTRNVLLWF